MKQIQKLSLSLLFQILLIAGVHAQISLPSFFSNGMVLQQQTDAPFWGKATPNQEVSVVTSWNNQEYKTQVNQDGYWKVNLFTPAAGGPYSVVLKQNNETLELRDVLIGEVWFCSGQSNMEMPMKGYKNQPIEGSAMDILKSANPQIKLFTVKRNSSIDVKGDVTGEWSSATPATVKEFSATAWYYGQLLQEMLQVPVGLICSSWGGSWVESWMSEEMLQPFPDVKLPKQESDVKEKNRTPTTLYNAMVAPLEGYPIRGVIWYQGESNYARYQSYTELFKSMVEGWRTNWGQGEFPFYYCQIAPYDYALVTAEGDEVINSAYLREAQLKAEKEIPNSGMAVLMDAGTEKGIHPPNKRIAGERLAFHALSKTYGLDGVTADSPVYKEMTVEGDTAILSFDRAEMWLTAPDGELNLFEIAGADKKFYPAQAWINRSKVYLKSEEVKNPVAVRYAFENYVKGDLFGTEGLPVSSFRTDNW